MTHTPPIPTGNQSPYPLQTPPRAHSDDAPPPGDARIARTPAAKPTPPPMGLIALAAGLGLAALAGGLFMATRDRKPKPKGRKPRRKQAR